MTQQSIFAIILSVVVVCIEAGGSERIAHHYPNGRTWSDKWNGNNVAVRKTYTYFGVGSTYLHGGYSMNLKCPEDKGKDVMKAAEEKARKYRPFPSKYTTISDSNIRSVLFPGSPPFASELIFNYGNESKPAPPRTQPLYEFNPGVDIARMNLETLIRTETNATRLAFLSRLLHEFKRKAGELDEIVYVTNKEKSIKVNEIAYFWGLDNVPKGSGLADCLSFTPLNDDSYTYWDVTRLKKCEKSLSDVVQVGHKYVGREQKDRRMIVQHEDGSSADSLAWFCGPLDVCSGWECKNVEEVTESVWDPPDHNFVLLVYLGIFFAICGAAILLICVWSYFRKNDAPTSPPSSHNSAELLPLNSAAAERPEDYPQQPPQYRQPSHNPTPAVVPSAPSQYPPAQTEVQYLGDVGWSITPKTPPPAYEDL